jgi:hypothetical protein
MKKPTKKIPYSSYLLANPRYLKKNKPGRIQLLTKKSCILNVIELPNKIYLLLSMTPQLSFWRVIYD